MVAAFREVQMPPKLAANWDGGPEFATDVIELRSGFSQRNIRWSRPMWRYDLIGKIQREPDARDIAAFIIAVAFGRAYAFRFHDVNDGVFDTIVGTLAGSPASGSFSLFKDYAYGGYSFRREITKPVASSLRVYVGVTELTNVGSPQLWGVNDTTGLLSIDNSPVTGAVRVTGDFDTPVRFANDFLPGTLSPGRLMQYRSLPLVEERIV